METLVQDVRYAIRMLRKSPGFTVVAVVVLALGIGANTAIFSVVNAVLLRPLPFQDPGRLVQVWHVPPPQSFHGMTRFAVSPGHYLDWASQNHAFEQTAIYRFSEYDVTGKDEPEAVPAIRVSPDFFSVLRARPVLGRFFVPEENEPGHQHVVVVSQGFWQTHLGSSPDIVGKSITLDTQPYTIVGVMPTRFRFPNSSNPKTQPQLWTPLAWSGEERLVRGNHNYHVMARLKVGLDAKQAQAEMNTISARLEREYPEDDKGWGAVVIPLRDQLVGDVRPALLVLLGAVAFVLLIACANVANLVLVKTLGRQKEIAIRTALGASRVRVLRQILSETVMLALTGGAVGLLVAHLGVRLIIAFLAQSMPRSEDIAVDAWVLAFTLTVSLLTGVMAGLAPALRATKSNLNDSLKQGLGRTDVESGGNRTRSALVVSEVALALVLLIGAGLMIRSLWQLRGVDPGLDAHNVLTMSFALPRVKYAQPVQQVSFFEQLLQRVQALPGVECAGAIDALPIGGDGSTQPIAVEAQPLLAMSEQPEVAVRAIETGFLHTMRIPVHQGREFNASDIDGKLPVILVSESMAKRFWPGQNPIGKHLTMSFSPGKSRAVVGVVGDVKQDGLDVIEPIATLYVPLAQNPSPYMSVVVRTSAQPASVVSAVANAVHQLDREQPMPDAITMDDILAASLSHQRFSMFLLSACSGLALLLAAIGIYSVLSYSVRRRLPEIGIRMALGAQRKDLLATVLGQALRLSLLGVGIGTAAAFALTRLMASQLFGITPTDPFTFLSVTTLLMLVALASCYVPARRATQVDPVVALRDE